MTDVRYERAHTERPTWTMKVDGTAVAVLTKTSGGQKWVATTIGAPAISIPACDTRHEAGMALLGRLAELGKL